MDTSQLIIDTAEKIFSDHCDKGLLDATEQGTFPQALWQQIVDNGFHQLGSPNSGTETRDLFAFLKVCGRYAVPLPMAEILLANQWLGGNAPAQGFATIGLQTAKGVVQAAWGRQAETVLGVSADSVDVSVYRGAAVTEQGANLAGEARDTVTGAAETQAIDTVEAPYAQLALARANLMAGGLQAVLDLTAIWSSAVSSGVLSASFRRSNMRWPWLVPKLLRLSGRRMPEWMPWGPIASSKK